MSRICACLLIAAPVFVLHARLASTPEFTYSLHAVKAAAKAVSTNRSMPQRIASYDPNYDPGKDSTPDPHGNDPHDEVHDPHLPANDPDAYLPKTPPPPKDDDDKK